MCRYRIFPLQENVKQSVNQLGILFVSSLLLTILLSIICHFPFHYLYIYIFFFFARTLIFMIIWRERRRKREYMFHCENHSCFSRTKGTRRGGKRERGGRGRCGRDRGRETGRQLFIEQQGIFSSGLNDDGRYNRTKSSISNGKFLISAIKSLRISTLRNGMGVQW